MELGRAGTEGRREGGHTGRCLHRCLCLPLTSPSRGQPEGALAAASPGSPWSCTTSLLSICNPEAHTERQSGHRGSQHNEAANGIVHSSGMGWKIETQSPCSRADASQDGIWALLLCNVQYSSFLCISTKSSIKSALCSFLLFLPPYTTPPPLPASSL